MTQLIIQEKINFISESLKQIADILKKRTETTLLSEYLLLAAEKKAEELIESAISINQEILKTHFDYLSNSYYESFIDLEKLKIFSPEELKSLAATAGFRNRLAHDYLELDPKITLQSIERLLKIYPTYLKKIKKFLST